MNQISLKRRACEVDGDVVPMAMIGAREQSMARKSGKHAARWSLLAALTLLSAPASAQQIREMEPEAKRGSSVKSDKRASAQDAKTTPAPVPEKDPKDFRWRGEEIFYSLQLNGVEALRAGVRAGDVRMRKGRPYIPVSGTAQSTGFFHSVYPVNDRANTFLDPFSYRPLRSEKVFEEAGKTRSYEVDFIHSLYRARVVKAKPDFERKFIKAIPGTTHDMFTWFYDLRDNYPFKIGQELTYYVYDGWKLSKLTGVVKAKEDLYTPLGWFKTYRIEFVREVLRSRHQKNRPPILKVRELDEQRASIWVSRDENMIPVKIAMKTPWGVGEIVVIKYKPPIDFNKPRD